MSVKSLLFKAGAKVRAHKSTIAVVCGVVSLTGAVVFAVKGGMEITPILDEKKAKVEKYKAKVKDEDEDWEEAGEEYTEEDCEEDCKLATKQAFVEVSKKLLLPIGLTGLAVTCFLYAYSNQRKEVKYLASALASTQTAFNAYRDRVRTYIDDETEEKIYRGMKREKTVDEDGNEVIRDVFPDDNRELGLKSIDRCFDESNPNWVDGADWNRDFLFRVQTEMQRLLEDRCDKGFGVVFLNEVYEALGYDKTVDGNILGWYYEYGKDAEHNHKGVIDFGLGCPDTASRLFMNGYEKNVWLRFNVDGDMLELLRTRGKSFR